jgi:hypothetical protein
LRQQLRSERDARAALERKVLLLLLLLLLLLTSAEGGGAAALEGFMRCGRCRVQGQSRNNRPKGTRALLLPAWFIVTI